MKRFQFSLVNACGFILILAGAITFGVNWVSNGLPSALESLLVQIWLSAVILSFWKSKHVGWRRVAEVTAVTGLVWTVSVFATHGMFVSTLLTYGIGFITILGRTGFLALLGILAAAVIAALLQLFLDASNSKWIRSAKGQLTLPIVVMAGIAAGVFSWNVRQTRIWQPTIGVLDDEIRQGIHAARLQWMNYQESSNRKFLASTLGSTLTVSEFGTEAPIQRFQAEPGSRFGSCTFLPDSSQLLAVIKTDAGMRVAGWNTADWKPRDTSALNELLAQNRKAAAFLLLVDGRIIEVSTSREGDTGIEIQVSRWDYEGDERWVETKFAPITGSVRDQVRPLDVSSSWLISTSGNCIISGFEVFDSQSRWVLYNGSSTAHRAPIQLLGFVGDSERFVAIEHGDGFAWKVPFQGDRPPFWDHWQTQNKSRVMVIDGATGAIVAQSDWWHCSMLYLDSTRMHVVARHHFSKISWDLRPFAE